MPSIVQVALPTPLRRLFDYLPPADSELPAVGARVRVPFGRQQLIGLVVALRDRSDVPADKLRPVTDVLDEEPLLPASLFELLRWAAGYYQHSPGDVMVSALPALLRQGRPAIAEPEYSWHITGVGRDAQIPERYVRQHVAMSALTQSPLPEADLQALGVEKPTLATLAEKGWLERRVISDAAAQPGSGASGALDLNDEQAAAVDRILHHLDQFQPFLLDGITGSGKTEVYLQAIDQVLQRGRQALVLVPEIGLTPQTIARFRRRFDCRIEALHSALTDRQRLDSWLAARDGKAGIIIGTRSALFTPLARPGIIIVDEEHDLSFKQQEGFRYSARDVALVRARKENIPIVLGSATPSLETLYQARLGRAEHLRLTERAGGATPPALKVLDLRNRRLDEGLSQPLIDTMNEHLERQGQCLLFLNRRGFSPTLLCHDCGWIAHCQRCDTHMTWHQGHNRLHCHHCGRQTPPPRTCPDCGKSEFVAVGLGTERIEQALARHFPDHKAIRIDRDTTRSKAAMADFIEQINSDQVDILVGTQMLAKGHHFPRLTLVGIIDVDGCLFSADFRAPERTAQLITQVAGRAGRAETRGEVVLQSHHPDHPLFRTLLTEGYGRFAEESLEERLAAGFPPGGALALFRAEAADPTLPQHFLQRVRDILKDMPEVSLWGPVPAPMPKRAGKHRAQLMMQAAQRAPLQAALRQWTGAIENLPEARKVRWSLDVDPQEVY